jgi:hypothetical protein
MKQLLKNLSIRKKMITSHGIIALLSLFCAILALRGIGGLLNDLNTIQKDAMYCVEAAGNLMYASADIERSILGIISDGSTEHYSRLEQTINEDITDIKAAFTTLETALTAFHAEDTAGLSRARIIQLFEEMGYTHAYGPDVERDYKVPYYADELTAALYRLNPSLPDDAISDALYKLTNYENGELVQKNAVFMDYLQNGV